MALMGDKDVSDEEISDGVDSLSNDSEEKDENTTNEGNQTTVSEDNHKMGVSTVASQRDCFDDLDQFEIKDDDIKDIGVISKNSLI